MMKNYSVSNVNGFLSWRTKWFLTKIRKFNIPMGPEPHRGTAVEQGVIAHVAQQLAIEDAIKLAQARYAELTADLDVDQAEKCGEAIPGLVTALGTSLQSLTEVHGKISAVQKRVECKFPDVTGDIPWLGFLDVQFEDGTILDLKVKGKTPSEMPGDWARQGAFYSHCQGGKDVIFLTGVPLKKGVNIIPLSLDLSTVPARLHELKEGARAIELILSMPENMQAYACLPSPDDWSLKDPMVMNAAQETWRIFQTAA